jgi:malate synthase
MTGTFGLLDASRALERDHRELGALVERVERGGDLASMARALAELHARLARHFNAEEKPGGLYDALGACAPEHRARVGELVDDHYRLTALVRELGQRACRAPDDEVDAVRDEVKRLAGQLAEHERRELELVQAAAAPDRSAAPA